MLAAVVLQSALEPARTYYHAKQIVSNMDRLLTLVFEVLEYLEIESCYKSIMLGFVCLFEGEEN